MPVRVVFLHCCIDCRKVRAGGVILGNDEGLEQASHSRSPRCQVVVLLSQEPEGASGENLDHLHEEKRQNEEKQHRSMVRILTVGRERASGTMSSVPLT
eukprot:16651-Hanusia_phi.AAC.1